MYTIYVYMQCIYTVYTLYIGKLGFSNNKVPPDSPSPLWSLADASTIKSW